MERKIPGRPMVARGWDARSTHLPLPGTANLRDLGGTPVAGGAVVAAGRLYRAEALVGPGIPTQCSVWDVAHADAYAALGVRTVIDLRSRHEQTGAASAWPEAAGGADLVLIPIDEGGEGDTDYVREIREGRRTAFSAADMADYYALTLRRRGDEFAAAIRVFAEPERLPVLVHCAAGKDRTGLLVAMVLEVLGTPRELVVADYALTGELRPNRVAAYAHLFEGTWVRLADVALLFDTPSEAMVTLLAGVDEEFGSVSGYLDHHGVTRSELDALWVNLTS